MCLKHLQADKWQLEVIVPMCLKHLQLEAEKWQLEVMAPMCLKHLQADKWQWEVMADKWQVEVLFHYLPSQLSVWQ